MAFFHEKTFKYDENHIFQVKSSPQINKSPYEKEEVKWAYFVANPPPNRKYL